ncbi:MAG: sulfatase-like hydrolase/transferase, partial [Thermoplasmata archaeon]|nr:sulfatase-like hydrolase/transferase [Thermoplasmata archaeon]
SIARLDLRIGRIIATLKSQGRWENTLFILTSDHGQAFGESGALFHEFSLDESVTRIPLWVRFPNAEHAGAMARGWSSLVDLAPTVAKVAGEDSPSPSSGHDLITLLNSDRPDPVYCGAEGLLWNQWPRLPGFRRAQLDRIRVAAYLGSSRLELDAETGVVSERPGPNRAEHGFVHEPVTARQRAELDRYVLDAADRIRHATSQPPVASVGERMTSWGY